MAITSDFDLNIELLFPNIRQQGYKLTSPETKNYNCIAWAATCNDKWWCPGTNMYYWPDDILQNCTLDSFIEAYKSLGYTICENELFEVNFEKVAIFVNSFNIPTHASRQLINGKWTSKLGKYKDIEHDLHGIEGNTYGKVSVILKRPKK